MCIVSNSSEDYDDTDVVGGFDDEAARVGDPTRSNYYRLLRY